MKKNNQSHRATRRQNQEGFLQKHFPVIMLVLTALVIFFRLELVARIGNLLYWVVLVAAAVVTILAFVAKHNDTTIDGLRTSWRASRTCSDEDAEDDEDNEIPTMATLEEKTVTVSGKVLHFMAPKDTMWFKKADGELYLEIPKKPEEAPDGKVLNASTNEYEDKPVPPPMVPQDLGTL